MIFHVTAIFKESYLFVCGELPGDNEEYEPIIKSYQISANFLVWKKCEIAKLLRAKYPQMIIDGSSRSDKKSAALRQVGFNDIIIDKDGALQTDKRYDKILELIGPATIKDSFKHLNCGGIICSTGQLGGKWYLEEFEPISEMAEDSYLTSFYFGNVKVQRLNDMFKFIEDNRVDVKPDKILNLTKCLKPTPIWRVQRASAK